MNLIHVTPAPGRVCPMPEKGGQLLPEAGDKVPRDAYWQRRINDGDAIRADAAPTVRPAVEPEPVAAPEPATQSKPARGSKVQ
ncbi:DUF2635 domain-containing protein [Pseudomonas sp. V1]|uniref:DUF2635 domain-containing protein n=1 Tax=Pseudomonas arcuscaelestis TaxID=2710591 RepID=UPI0019401F07|nr:DUF2635 domain-containing protein [Pseudomonas arcuscaelestis]